MAYEPPQEMLLASQAEKRCPAQGQSVHVNYMDIVQFQTLLLLSLLYSTPLWGARGSVLPAGSWQGWSLDCAVSSKGGDGLQGLCSSDILHFLNYFLGRERAGSK